VSTIKQSPANDSPLWIFPILVAREFSPESTSHQRDLLQGQKVIAESSAIATTLVGPCGGGPTAVAVLETSANWRGGRFAGLSLVPEGF
jgi:hypothetical protein